MSRHESGCAVPASTLPPPEIVDDSTAEEVAEALTWHCRETKRLPCLVGLPSHPTRYDVAHARLNRLLDLWERAH
jgi:hypothetical protein